MNPSNVSKYDKRDGKEVIKFLIPTNSMTVKSLVHRTPVISIKGAESDRS